MMPHHVRELLMILGYGFVPSLESLAKVQWEHPNLPGSVESTITAAELIRGEPKATQKNGASDAG